MKLCKFIVADEIQQKGRTGNKPIFSTFMDGQCIFELEEACPIIKRNQGCIGMGVPFELHINQGGTIIFYTELTGGIASDRDFLDSMYDAWLMSIGDNQNPGRGRTDRDTQRTGIDAATRMMMGTSRSAGEIARGGRERPSPNYGSDTLFKAINGYPEEWD